MQTGSALFLTILIVVCIVAGAGFFLSENLHMIGEVKEANAKVDQSSHAYQQLANNIDDVVVERDQCINETLVLKDQLFESQKNVQDIQVKNGILQLEIERLNAILNQQAQEIINERTTREAFQAEVNRQKSDNDQITVQRDIALQEWKKALVEVNRLRQGYVTSDGDLNPIPSKELSLVPVQFPSVILVIVSMVVGALSSGYMFWSKYKRISCLLRLRSEQFR